MAGFIRYESVVDGGTYTMPCNGFLLIAANGATVTVKINLNATGTDSFYDFTDTIENGKVKCVPFELPQGLILKFTGSNVQLIAYD